jgi:hypothetical protein
LKTSNLDLGIIVIFFKERQQKQCAQTIKPIKMQHISVSKWAKLSAAQIQIIGPVF